MAASANEPRIVHEIGDDVVRLDPPPPAPETAPRPGRGRVAVERVGGRSVVRRAYATSPLRLLTPKNHGHAAWVYTSSHGGGLVDGDDVAPAGVGRGPGPPRSCRRSPPPRSTGRPAGPGPRSTPTSARTPCSSPPPTPWCASRGPATGRRSASPSPPAGGLVLVDRVTSGRRESGERWLFDEYVSRTSVHLGGRLVVRDAVALRAADGGLAARFGRYDVLAVAMVLGRGLEGETARIDARVRAEPVRRGADRLVAAAPVGDAGCILRIAGRTVEDVDDTLGDLLGFVPGLLGDSPWARKW